MRAFERECLASEHCGREGLTGGRFNSALFIRVEITLAMRFLNAALGSFLLAGCMIPPDAHENFVRHLRGWVGQDIRRHTEYSTFVQSKQSADRHLLTWTRRFPPGTGICTVVFEVDPQNHKVLDASFSGARRDCVLAP